MNEIVPVSGFAGDSLVQIDRLRQEIEAARSIPDVKGLRDKAEAIRHYLQQADESLAVLNSFAELRIRAERRAGQILLEMSKNQARRAVGTADDQPTLAELGVTKTQSFRWQQIAALPDPTFETYLEGVQTAGRELTTSGLLTYARRWHRSRNPPERITPCHDWTWPEDSPYQLYCRKANEGFPGLPPASIQYIFAVPPASPQAAYRILAQEAPRVLCPGGSLFLFARQDDLPGLFSLFANTVLHYQWTLRMDGWKKSAGDLPAHGVEHTWITILWWVRGAYEGPVLRDHFSFWDSTRTYADMVKQITPMECVILDPFMSATSGVLAEAIIERGRLLIGYDTSPEYVKKMTKDLDKWYPPIPNFT